MNESLPIPQDAEMERAILGMLITDNTQIEKVINILDNRTFFNDSHQQIYRSIKDLSRDNYPVDVLTIADNLKSHGRLEEVGGHQYLAELEIDAPLAGNIIYYAKMIKDHEIMRSLIEESQKISRLARDPEQNVNELLIRAQENILKISESKVSNNAVQLKEVLGECVRELEEKHENGEEFAGIPTGFSDVDKLISGLIAPDLLIIAARPSMGKSALALNILEYIHTKNKTNKASLIFSREMSNKQNGNRFLSSSSSVDGNKIKTGRNLTQEDFDKLARSTGILSEASIFLDEKSNTMDKIEHEARSLNRRHKEGLGLVVIDYLQLVEGKTKSQREQEVADMSRRSKSLAKDLNIPIIALSQLSRKCEDRTDKRGQLSDLRESGSIEQDADIIMFIYRDEVYNKKTQDRGIAEILIRKHRNGPTGIVKLKFEGKYTRFSNLSQYDIPLPNIANNKPHWTDND
jgi:replicative DNA helicase